MSTSTQRTYRYVRLSILGAVLAVAVAVVAVIVRGGPLASISAVHYTAGSAVFTGSVVALSLAFLALAGRSPSQALLDIAALVAPLIALVPTPIESGDVPGVRVDCDVPCVPAEELPGIDVGVVTWLVVAAVAIVAAIVLGVVQRTLRGPLAATIAVAALAVIAAGLWWGLDRASFVLGAHVVAATTFFALIAAVSALAARRRTGPFRALYAATATLIAIDLVALLTVVLLRFADVDLAAALGQPLVLYGETIALALFAVFWTVQTVEDWDDPDPAARVTAPAAVATAPRRG